MPILTQIVLIVIITVTMLVLIYFFLKLIKQEKDKEKDEYVISSGESLGYDLFIKFVDKKTKENRGRNYFTLFRVEINRFFEVEEMYNKEDAENIIKQVHYHIKQVLPPTSKIAYGNNLGTILIFLSKIYQESELILIGKKIKKAAELKIKVFNDIYIDKTTTVSYTKFPVNGNTAERLLESLSIASYLGEKAGGDRISGYSNEMDRDKEFLDFYYEVKQAIQKREFDLYYQPIIKLDDKTVYGFESLVRWTHPQKGVLSPGDFMKIMENSGDIHWIGIWGLETVIKSGLEMKNVTANNHRWHINISHRQLMSKNIVNEYQKLVSKYRFEAADIVLEIIDFENALEHEEALKTILKLKNIGFKIAATINKINYQMLNQIEQYKVGILKVNVNTLKPTNNVMHKQFVESLKELVKRSKIEVIVEAIENKEEENEALDARFNLGQGFYYSRPLNRDKIDEFLINHSKTINVN